MLQMTNKRQSKSWLLDHPSFLSNPFYVAGDSYGGKMAPLVALEIIGGNEGFQLPLVNLKLTETNSGDEDYRNTKNSLCAANLKIFNENGPLLLYYWSNDNLTKEALQSSRYVTVDEERGAELFYYFVESERNPTEDPLILWLVGGPYCSAFIGFALGIGPLNFKAEHYNGTLPTLIYNPYSWTKISSILFLDWPVGSGFSFSRSIENYVTDEVQTSKQIYKFLKKWLVDHPSFLSNPFYVGGDSYGGKMVPLVALDIVGGNEGLQLPLVNLKGYLIGNPVTGERIDDTSKAPHAHGLGIISDELLKVIETNCEGEDYRNTKNDLCVANLKIFDEFLSEINIYSILEPTWSDHPSKVFSEAKRSLEEKTSVSLGLQSELDIDCTNPFVLSYYWSNDNLTKEALHIKQGTVEEWQRCRIDLNNYTYNIASSVPHHLKLISRGYRALVYSGDHDLDIPFIGTLDWVRSLNFSIVEDWHSWRAGGQVAGYTMLFSNNLTFATVMGGNHVPSLNMPRQSFSMFESWISHELL